MNRKTLIPTVLFLLAALFSVAALSAGGGEPAAESSIILFYGDGCPHCAIVDEFVAANSIEEKVPFVRKEVYYNKQNASELAEKARVCGLPTDSVGVPFLYDGEKCLIGDRDIIEFFTSKVTPQ